MIERKVPAWMQEAKPRGKAVAANHPPLREWPSIKYVSRFIGCMMFWGLVALVSSSSFPLALGLFFFCTDEAFVAWVLERIGIRLVPETLGPELINASVFLIGVWILLAHWKDAAPKWLLSWLPTADVSWSTLGLAALACAALKTASTAVIKKLLPRLGIAIASDRQDWAILGLMGAGVAVFYLIPTH
jgi:hypothetical protein